MFVTFVLAPWNPNFQKPLLSHPTAQSCKAKAEAPAESRDTVFNAARQGRYGKVNWRESVAALTTPEKEGSPCHVFVKLGMTIIKYSLGRKANRCFLRLLNKLNASGILPFRSQASTSGVDESWYRKTPIAHVLCLLCVASGHQKWCPTPASGLGKDMVLTCHVGCHGERCDLHDSPNTLNKSQ
jgi:hypothetical protein